MGNIFFERVEAVRRMMAAKGWNAVVAGASDPHSSEYPAPRWQAVKWLSGFTGEAGELVITADHAGLWTDSRYFIQALEQLQGTGIELHRTGQPDSVPVSQWLAAHASVVAADGGCMSAAAMEELEKALSEAHSDGDWKVVDVPDFMDGLWTDRPKIPVTPIVTLDGSDVGESRMQKLVWLRKFLMSEDCDAILLSSLDEIAWLLNVRGNDIEYNPYVISWLYVSLDRAVWFVRKDNNAPLDQDTADSFMEIRADGVEIAAYDDVYITIADQDVPDARLYVDRSSLNAHLYRYVSEIFGKGNVICGPSPVALRKSVKNPVEIAALREAYLEDGCAVEKFLYWLEKTVAFGENVTEYQAAMKLDAFRSEIDGYRGNSFATISAYGPDAALPHYSTPAEGSAVLEPHGLYLVDSGGQYFSGTTDITRTVPLGECSDLEREDYTLVLKGMIQLAMAVFPEGTPGCRLDVLARNALWRVRRNFGHGTGHGVGFCLGVHEGPQSIRQDLNAQPLVPGMVTSDEPGIYRQGQHGVRHENILLCVDAGSNGFGKWLSFETLTVCHIDTAPVVRSMMTEEEAEWLNRYNASVYERLSPLLPEDVSQWLKSKVQPL